MRIDAEILKSCILHGELKSAMPHASPNITRCPRRRIRALWLLRYLMSMQRFRGAIGPHITYSRPLSYQLTYLLRRPRRPKLTISPSYRIGLIDDDEILSQICQAWVAKMCSSRWCIKISRRWHCKYWHIKLHPGHLQIRYWCRVPGLNSSHLFLSHACSSPRIRLPISVML